MMQPFLKTGLKALSLSIKEYIVMYTLCLITLSHLGCSDTWSTHMYNMLFKRSWLIDWLRDIGKMEQLYN